MTTDVKCPSCDGPARIETAVDSIEYRHGELGRVEISVEIEVTTCEVCKESFTAPGTEERRTNAICKYLNIPNAEEAVRLREKAGHSQEQLAELMGVPAELVKRWERGATLLTMDAAQGLRFMAGEPIHAHPVTAECIVTAKAEPVTVKVTGKKDIAGKVTLTLGAPILWSMYLEENDRKALFVILYSALRGLRLRTEFKLPHGQPTTVGQVLFGVEPDRYEVGVGAHWKPGFESVGLTFLSEARKKECPNGHLLIFRPGALLDLLIQIGNKELMEEAEAFFVKKWVQANKRDRKKGRKR